MIQLNYRDARPLYEQIKEKFRHLIISGAMTCGTALPSVRELAQQLTVNPNTIQKAYRDLELECYIYSVKGKGSFVAEQDKGNHVYQQRIDNLLEKLDGILTELSYLGYPDSQIRRRVDTLLSETQKQQEVEKYER